MPNEPLPFFKFYPADFLNSETVKAMDLEAVGAYVLLLCHSWLATPPCSIPADGPTLERIVGKASPHWPRIEQQVLSAFGVSRRGRRINRRLLREYEAAMARKLRISRLQSVRRKACKNREKSTTGQPVVNQRSLDNRLQIAQASACAENSASAEFSPPSRAKPAQRPPPPPVATWGESGGILLDCLAWSWRGITPDDKARWRAAYPAVDIDRELLRAAEWCRANPRRGRRKNYRRFLTNWLNKTQESGGSRGFVSNGELVDFE